MQYGILNHQLEDKLATLSSAMWKEETGGARQKALIIPMRMVGSRAILDGE